VIFLEIEVAKIYRHFKGNLYRVIAIAYDSETEKKVVVYQALYGDNKIWVRDYEMFTSLVDKKKYPLTDQEYRFQLVKC